jgi:hypothetical protein
MNPARYSLICAVVGLFLWLLSSWIPLSMIPSLQGRNLDFLAFLFPASEAGALLAAMVGIAYGVEARRRSEPGTPRHTSATWRLMLNALVPFLVVVPNIVFPLLDG